jgi:hypothetical protein
MKKLNGVISDRLRALFTRDQILNNPRRSDSTKMPSSGVEGIKLTGRKPKKK